jgi:hypothetical protein
MRDVDPRILIERNGPTGGQPRHDATPIGLLSVPGRALQAVRMRTWLEMVATCMAGIVLVCVPTGFGLLPGRAPLVPLLMLMIVFSSMAVAGANNGRDAAGRDRSMRACLRAIEVFGWCGILGALLMIALVVIGVMDVR